MSDSDKTEEIVDYFGECVIEEVYDPALFGANSIIDLTTKNSIDQKNYSVFSDFTEEQKEKLKELMKCTTIDIIYRFLEMIESEKMGSEIADAEDEEGWIRKFSEL